MKKLYILAALLLATTSAQAGGISFQFEGQRINIEAPRGCNSLSCINITAPGFKGFKSNRDDDDVDAAPAPARPEYSDSKRYNDDRRYDDKRYNDDDNGKPRYKGYQAKRYNDDVYAAPARSDRAPPPDQVTAPRSGRPPRLRRPSPQPPLKPTSPNRHPRLLPSRPLPGSQRLLRLRLPPLRSDPNSPIGVWATEENKGNVRIEPCGDNLCGYSEKSGEKILINMRPQGSKWAGRINDPDSGRKYDSTIQMKSNGSLRVQGCAFGGMFCGGQTWKRVS